MGEILGMGHHASWSVCAETRRGALTIASLRRRFPQGVVASRPANIRQRAPPETCCSHAPCRLAASLYHTAIDIHFAPGPAGSIPEPLGDAACQEPVEARPSRTLTLCLEHISGTMHLETQDLAQVNRGLSAASCFIDFRAREHHGTVGPLGLGL